MDFFTNELIAKFDAFLKKKLFAGVTAVSWNVCLIYCMRRMRISSGKWPTIRNILFNRSINQSQFICVASYYHLQKFSPWNFVTLIVFLPCHSAILTCTSVHYCRIYFTMLIK